MNLRGRGLDPAAKVISQLCNEHGFAPSETRPRRGYFRLLGSERRLLEFALDLFGEPLSRFLLSGLGEETEAQVWLFSVSFADGSGVARGREIRVEPDDIPREPRVLPGRREPLVILALLRLLIETHGPSSSTLSYSQEQVLNLLG